MFRISDRGCGVISHDTKNFERTANDDVPVSLESRVSKSKAEAEMRVYEHIRKIMSQGESVKLTSEDFSYIINRICWPPR